MNHVIFGDVHGQARQLSYLLRRAQEEYGVDTQFYSVGDLVDRGPNSKEVINICMDSRVQAIIGNHELWLCSVLSGYPMSDTPFSKIMGGIATLQSYGLDKGHPEDVGPALLRAVPKAQREWLLDIPPHRFIEVAGVKYLLAHAGIFAATLAQIRDQAPGFPEERVPDLIRQSAPNMYFWSGPKPHEPDKIAKFNTFVQVFGHTPIDRVVDVTGHYIALDTGCGTCPPFALSAVVLLEDGGREILSVQKGS